MKLIDKDALVAEIERKKSLSTFQNEFAKGTRFGLEMAIEIINSIEVKEADMEKELEDWIGDRVGKWTGKECERMCRYFFELGLKAQKGDNI